jgi:hypothetical protein
MSHGTLVSCDDDALTGDRRPCCRRSISRASALSASPSLATEFFLGLVIARTASKLIRLSTIPN